jgi:hypothetical protein
VVREVRSPHEGYGLKNKFREGRPVLLTRRAAIAGFALGTALLKAPPARADRRAAVVRKSGIVPDR